MSAFQALVLGIIQGLSEFLPISSSGHLVIVPFIFGWREPTLAFDVAVHFGTLIAVVWVFREKVLAVVRTIFTWGRATVEERALVRLLAIGTIPAVAVGVAFDHAVSDSFQRPVIVSLLLGVTGYFLLASESVYEKRGEQAKVAGGSLRTLEEIKTGDAAAIGIAQAVAILPGISRSGSTIGAGMRLGLTRETAAAFSFLLSIPVLLGATVYKLPDITHEASRGSADAFIIGLVASGVTGFFAIKWFLRMIERVGLRPFGVYLFFVMMAGLLTGLARG
ncbi:MAG: undecaprenyl-diphosphatase UppP [Actinomycetota bacterium]